MLLAFAYSASMNNPSAAQSRSACRVCDAPEVVSMPTSSSRELELGVAEMTNFCGRRRAHCVRVGLGGGVVREGFCTTFVTLSGEEVVLISSTGRQAQRFLLLGSRGVHV